jgi:hypothetical protein
VETQNWELRRGTYNIYVGASVLDIKLKGSFTLGDAGPTAKGSKIGENNTRRA